jgi:uncharacterized protein YjiK
MTRLFSYTTILIIALSCISNSCSSTSNDAHTRGSQKFSYNLALPDADYKLESALREISGISWYRNNNIACIQDEQAVIYMFDTQKERISDSYSFGKHGDFEDIAVNNDTAWILESNGTIYKVAKFTDKSRETFIYPTILSAKNDTEGLVYDLKRKNLLIACKNQASYSGHEKLTGYKAIYRFETNDNKLKESPEFLINLAQFNDYEGTSYFKNISLKLAKKMGLTGNSWFQPSGLAIHPFNENIYIISANPQILLVIDRNGDIRNIIPLDKHTFKQPEGICFSPEGDLYISNEGGNGRGNILKFNYIPI